MYLNLLRIMSIIKYFGVQHKFSHFHPSPIKLYGRDWTTVEQLYQNAKAELGNDKSTAALIQAEPEGRGQKALSRRIKNKHHHLWNLVKQPIMVHFDFQKFHQNQHLQEFLLSTGNRPLIENNPHDRYWGCERNEAGKVLMQLRSHFAKQPNDLPEILILGDSLLRNLNHNRMSQELGQKIYSISLSGATLEYIMLVAKFITGPFIKKLIVFGGTNSLSTKNNCARMGPNQLISKVQTFAKQFATNCPQTELYLCQIPNRPRSEGSRVASHIQRYNEKLATTNFKNNPKIIKFQNFPNNQFLDGLHFNRAGTQQLERYLIAPLSARGVV
jgi:ribA/ribD-fused uncharacterized protein